MGAAAILQLVLEAVPEAVTLYEQIRTTLSESDLGMLDTELAAADAAVTAGHDALSAAIATAGA